MAGMIGSVAGLGMQAYGMGQQRKQQKKQQALARQMAEVNTKINQVYEVQAHLEYNRRTWEIFRDQQRARSEALATTTNQGAAGRGSSALPGAYGQIAGQVGGELLKNNQNYELYQQLQTLFNKMNWLQAESGQVGANISSIGAFSNFAGQAARILPAFGRIGLLGSSSE